MANKKIIILICVVMLVVVVSTIAVFFYAMDRGFTALTNWQVGWAITDSIGRFYEADKRLPESWEEVKDSYIANEFHISGYGFDVNKLDEAIDINFRYLKGINGLLQSSAIIQEEWVLRLKSDSNNKLLEEQNNRLNTLRLRVLAQPQKPEME